jgi:hypothetical protein
MTYSINPIISEDYHFCVRGTSLTIRQPLSLFADIFHKVAILVKVYTTKQLTNRETYGLLER